MTRKAFLQAALVLCVTANLASAAPTGIYLIEQVYTVWGNAGYKITNTYYQSDNAAVTGTASGIGMDGYLGTATSSASPDGLSAYRIGDAGCADAYAQSRYTFTPDGSWLVLDFSGTIGEWAFENLAAVLLTDVTAGVSIYSYASPHELDDLDDTTIGGFDFEVQSSFAVDPTHVYELTGLVEAHRGEGGTGSADMSLTFYSVVPAPSAIFLAGLGAAFVTRLRKHRML